MPPLHPAFVHFPIALVGFSFIADLLGRLLNRPSLRSAGFWSLIGALLGGIAAAATGYFDFGRDALGDTYQYVDFHMDMGWILLGSVVVLTAWRWFAYARRDLSPGVPYLITALLVVGLTLFQFVHGLVGPLSLLGVILSRRCLPFAAGSVPFPAAATQRLDKI